MHRVKLPGKILIILTLLTGVLGYQQLFILKPSIDTLSAETEQQYWLELKRKSQQETLYFGEPGNKDRSHPVKEFKVKPGIVGERPTPLPILLGRKYWVITDKKETHDSLETAPYFLTLDIPVSREEPYGPVPYNECHGQCNWIIPGAFGLHGVAGDENKLSDSDPGSSGCVRHRDEDITFLYDLIDPQKEEIRYYIEDI